MHANEEISLSMITLQGKFLPIGNFISLCAPDKKNKTLQWHTCRPMNAKQICMQVITRKARIKYVALLNVLFYKWLAYPAGIRGWHCAAVTTTISLAHACLSMGASSQKSNVRCYPSPLAEKDPVQHWGLGGPASQPATEKHHYWARFALERCACHDCTMTTILRIIYFISQPGSHRYKLLYNHRVRSCPTFNFHSL